MFTVQFQDRHGASWYRTAKDVQKVLGHCIKLLSPKWISLVCSCARSPPFPEAGILCTVFYAPYNTHTHIYIYYSIIYIYYVNHWCIHTYTYIYNLTYTYIYIYIIHNIMSSHCTGPQWCIMVHGCNRTRMFLLTHGLLIVEFFAT